MLSFFTNLDVCKVVSFFFSLFFLVAAVQHFLSVLKYIITEALPASLNGWALAKDESILELSGSGFVCYGSSPGLFPKGPSLQPPPLPKPCSINTIQMFSFIQTLDATEA